MTDRELLDLAAKASGVLTESWYGNKDYFDGLLTSWNPLNDNGDALRLAVELRLEVYIHEDSTLAMNANLQLVLEPHNGDPLKATRRAIVLVAAKMGKEKEK
jgi:hypothetical protein